MIFLIGSYMAVYEVEYALLRKLIIKQNYKIEIKMNNIPVNELK